MTIESKELELYQLKNINLKEYRVIMINDKGIVTGYERKIGTLYEECYGDYASKNGYFRSSIYDLVEYNNYLLVNLSDEAGSYFLSYLPNEITPIQLYSLEILAESFNQVKEMFVQIKDGKDFEYDENVYENFALIALQNVVVNDQNSKTK